MKRTICRLIPLLIISVLITFLLTGCVPVGYPMASQSEQQATWTMILALIAPLVIATLKQSGWSKRANSLVALGLCLAVGVADAFYFGQVDSMDIAQTTFNVLTGAFASYKMIFQPFGFDDWWTDKTSFISSASRVSPHYR